MREGSCLRKGARVAPATSEIQPSCQPCPPGGPPWPPCQPMRSWTQWSGLTYLVRSNYLCIIKPLHSISANQGIIAISISSQRKRLANSLKGEPSVDIGKIILIFGEREKCFFFIGDQIMDYQSQLWFDNIRKHRHPITQRRKRCKYFIQQMMTSIALVSEQSFKIMQWQVTELNPFSGGNGILPTAW